MQAYYRGYKKRVWYNGYKANVITIQKVVKRYLQQKRFASIKAFLIRLQAIVRLFLCRKHKKMNAAAHKIQSFMKTMYPILIVAVKLTKYCRKDRRELKELRKERKEQEEHEKLKKETIAKAAKIKAKKAAVEVIERYWSKRLWKKELKKAREFLKKLPHDCRVLWVKLNCAKAQAVNLKQEIDELVNKRNCDDGD